LGTAERVQRAKENIILRRETHLDQLIDKLQEPRVRRVIEPILSGEGDPESLPSDDVAYARDLGLIQAHGRQLAIANPIYQEVIPIIFNRDANKPWAEKIYTEMQTHNAMPITIWGMSQARTHCQRYPRFRPVTSRTT